MGAWKSLLKQDPTQWLMEETDPSLRYFTLRWQLDKSEEDPDVIAASKAISQSAPVKKILS